MKSTPEEIEAALANYRKVTAERNKRELQVFVDAIMNADFSDELTAEEFTKEEVDKERLEAAVALVGGDTDFLTHPTELIDRYDELAAQLWLDGTTGGDLDPEARANILEPYFKAVEAALKEKAPEEVKDIISVPEEFRVLGRHVTGICGPELPYAQTMYPMSFWCDGSAKDYATKPSRILSPEDTDLVDYFDERIALGWDPGTTVEDRWICVYVQEEDKSWGWKFVYWAIDQTKVFDTIPALLEWFLYYTEEGTPVVEGLTADDVVHQRVWHLADRKYLD